MQPGSGGRVMARWVDEAVYSSRARCRRAHRRCTSRRAVCRQTAPGNEISHSPRPTRARDPCRAGPPARTSRWALAVSLRSRRIIYPSPPIPAHPTTAAPHVCRRGACPICGQRAVTGWAAEVRVSALTLWLHAGVGVHVKSAVALQAGDEAGDRTGAVQMSAGCTARARRRQCRWSSVLLHGGGCRRRYVGVGADGGGGMCGLANPRPAQPRTALNVPHIRVVRYRVSSSSGRDYPAARVEFTHA
ncbi:hypothetical protein C8F04DRAFT_358996 [Mycena alexandri]|uniref:Uncharacterized protein n=1 Tax=Mycena alexandri TaxID=1745969 RepID=A0AAD6S0W5_9AGAR|nr:hypothetical protein C8F04DRAFT_358996 [Mycena alexandri]